MKSYLIAIVYLIVSSSLATGQDKSTMLIRDKKFKYDLNSNSIKEDTNIVKNRGSKTQNVNIGGIFLSPDIGLSFPLGDFSGTAGNGFIYGAKIEIAFIKLYPFVPGIVFQGQNFKGNAGFISNNLLNSFDTDIYYFGGSVDIILNKFIKSNFTTPVLSAEIKYANVKRNIQPEVTLPNIPPEQSLLTYSAGLAFTLYVFDLNTKYTYAEDYSNLSFGLRFHFPVVRF
jgi:hypothetical protein